LAAAETETVDYSEGDAVGSRPMEELVTSLVQSLPEDEWDEDKMADEEAELVQDEKKPTAADFKKSIAAVEANIDNSVSPCDDFYQHACGTWTKKTKLPPSHSTWTRSFSEISHRGKAVLKSILEGKAKIPEKDLPKPLAEKLHTFYDSCMNKPTLAKQGVKPMKAFLAKYLPQIKDAPSFMKVLANLGELGLDQLFSFGIFPDPKRPLVHITSISQGGLGLPDRSYYFKNKKGVDLHKEIREKKYLPLIEFGLGQSGYGQSPAVVKAKKKVKPAEPPQPKLGEAVLAFETELAKATVDRLKLRNPVKTYHMLTQAELYKSAPLLKHYFDARKDNAKFWKKSPRIYTSTPTFFADISKLISKTPGKVLSAYLQWHLTQHLAVSLSDKVSYPYFKFYSQDLSGVKQRSARWKRCYYSTRGNLSDILSRAFVAKMFRGDSKAKARQIVHLLERTFATSLKTLKWLDNKTRKKALIKLKALVDMIGYPDKWKTYKKAIIGPVHFNNVLALAKVSNDRNLNKLGKPVDRNEWGMSSAEVNAYYSSSTNQIVFPAAILQPPFFSSKYPMAMNMGSIGSVMGHELTHGYDDEGRLYGPHGRLHSWWEPKTAKEFKKKVACVSNEYSSFQLPGKPKQMVNGKLTLGEDLADNGGLQTSWHAYHAWAAKQPGGMKAQKFGKFTGDQLFFYSFGQAWCTKQAVKSMRLQALTDPHAPSQFRVNGAVKNFAAFAKAFKCKAGTKMNPGKGKRCMVWWNDTE